MLCNNSNNTENVDNNVSPTNNLSFDIHNKYHSILMSQDVDLFKNTIFDVDIAMNYIKEIVKKSLIRSFYFLYKHDPTIINMTFDNGMNLLHLITPTAEYKKMIYLFVHLNQSLLDKPDNNDLTPPMYHAIHNPILLSTFLNYPIDITRRDKNNNTLIHSIIQQPYIHILRHIIDKYPDELKINNTTLKSNNPINLSILQNMIS